MRLLRIGLVALVAVPIAAAASGRADSIRLPAALIARTDSGEFAIRPDGGIVRRSRYALPVPANASWWPNGVWVRTESGHVVYGRWRRTLWRSAGRVPHASAVGDIVVGRHALAFSTYWRGSRLYVAPLGGRQHFVARGEFPLGWTDGSLYVGRNPDGAVLLRSGKRERRIVGASVRTAAYAPANHSLYFVSGNRLFRTHGSSGQVIADLAEFGLPSDKHLQLQLLGRLVALQDKRRLVVLSPGGPLFASTLLPRWRRGWPWLTGEPTAGRGGVAFAVMHAHTPRSSNPIERGVETVFLLRPGAREAVVVHRQRLRFNVCGHGAELSWHGTWLLYSTGEGPAAAIDIRSGRTIELTSLVRRLPGFRGDDSGPFSLAWR